jgi:hypothetical protein
MKTRLFTFVVVVVVVVVVIVWSHKDQMNSATRGFFFAAKKNGATRGKT